MLHTMMMYLTSQKALAMYQLFIVLVGIPLANEVVNKYKGTRAGSILQGVCLALLKTPLLGGLLAKIPAVGEFLYVFAPTDKSDLPKPLMKMFLDNKKSKGTGSGSAAASASALIFVALSALSGCAAMKAVAIDFASCELGKLPGSVMNIVPDVEKALVGQDVAWQNDLEAIGKKAGVDAVNCAIASVLHNASQFHGALTAEAKVKVVRGRTWLATHGHAAVQ